MINLIVADPYLELINNEALTRAAETTLKSQPDIPDCDLSVVIEDDEHLHNLNKDFLGIDSPTDVLSFPSGEEDVDPENGRFYLGDIIISYPRALEQATTGGHSTNDEITLLVVHGVLHLAGHDHAEPEEKALMWKVQKEVLDSLDVHLSRLPE